MTTEEWKDYLGEQKFNEIVRIAENPTALEALEDVLCVEIKQDNSAAPGRPADAQGNWLFSYILQAGGSVSDEMLMKQARGYVVGLSLVQNALRAIEKFKPEPKKENPGENPAV